HLFAQNTRTSLPPRARRTSPRVRLPTKPAPRTAAPAAKRWATPRTAESRPPLHLWVTWLRGGWGRTAAATTTATAMIGVARDFRSVHR
ncbi:unnamed protein product, partial [Ectocarpus sp. 4 AP-2014]